MWAIVEPRNLNKTFLRKSSYAVMMNISAGLLSLLINKARSFSSFVNCKNCIVSRFNDKITCEKINYK